MSFLNKVVEVMPKQVTLTRRLFNGGFETMGVVDRKPDTRTTEQLLENIEYYAQRCPEVAKFKDELKQINPEHLGLVSDICELANSKELLNSSINMKKIASNGKSLFEFLMEKLPKASKENPESLELSKAIINHTDSIASKVALGCLSPLYECKEATPYIKVTIPLIKDIAQVTLKGGYLMDYSKETQFVDAIKRFISKNVQLDKLEIFSKINEVADNAKAMCNISAFPFLENKTPISKIIENLKTFIELDKNMEGKIINLTEFLEKNTNLS